MTRGSRCDRKATKRIAVRLKPDATLSLDVCDGHACAVMFTFRRDCAVTEDAPGDAMCFASCLSEEKT